MKRFALLATLVASAALAARAAAQTSGEDNNTERCAAGTINGISPENAATAVQLVCSEITKRVGAGNGESYRVDMGRLGRIAILTVRTIRPGQPDKSLSARLADIEEVAVAAPRIGEAVATGKPFEATAGVDNLVAQENRKYADKKRDGESLYGAGLYGMTLFGGGDDPNGAGVIGKYEYQMPTFSAGVSGFFNIEFPLFVGVSVDGRKFFNETDFAPFAGGGLAYLGFNGGGEGANSERVSNASLGAYVSGGFEAFRSYKNRLTIEGRLMLPLGSATRCQIDSDYNEDCSDGYALPAMVNLTFLMPN